MSSKKNSLLKKNKVFIYPLVSIILVFITYSSSLFRSWQPFDERLFYKEEFLPIPQTLNEIFEIINSFVLNCHLLSTNMFFSNHLTFRTDPVNWGLLVFIFYLFKKNALLYHIFQLSIHLINTLLVWLVLYKSTNIFTKEINKAQLILITIFSLLWGLHGTNTEAVLLTTNWNTILTSTICFSFLFYEIRKIDNESFKPSIKNIFFVSTIYFISMLLSEYGYTFPIVVFFIIFAFRYKLSGLITDSASTAFKQSLPYFIGLGGFIIFSLFKENSPFVNLSDSSFYVFLERNLWLTPQIFIHFIKLIFYPETLSTYQSNLIYLTDSLADTYSLLCLTTYLLFLLLPLILFFIFKNKKIALLFPLTYAFYFSLFPFLHIILPTYCVIAERYCYFPLFLVLLIIFQSLAFIKTSFSRVIVLSLLIISLLPLTIRTYTRIQEWKNPYEFFKSAISRDTNPLYKAYKHIIFANYLSSEGNHPEKEKSLKESLSLLEKSLKLYSNKKTQQPLTLKLYGLDNESLLLKTVYAITTIKNDFYNESPKLLLSYYEPYIKNRLNFIGINQIALYAALLSKDGQLKLAKEILEYGLKRFPYSPELLISLANFYLYERDLENSDKILKWAYKIFPNDPQILRKCLSYFEMIDDRENIAKFAYLIGLREHSITGYQRAAEVYMNLNQPDLAQKALNKLNYYKVSDNITSLLTKRYFDLTGKEIN